MLDKRMKDLFMKVDAYQHEVKSGLKYLDQRFNEMNIQLTKNTTILDEHVKRTRLLEQAVEPLKLQREKVDRLEKEFKPVQKQSIILNGFFRISAAIVASGGAILGIIWGIKRIFF